MPENFVTPKFLHPERHSCEDPAHLHREGKPDETTDAPASTEQPFHAGFSDWENTPPEHKHQRQRLRHHDEVELLNVLHLEATPANVVPHTFT